MKNTNLYLLINDLIIWNEEKYDYLGIIKYKYIFNILINKFFQK